MVNWRQQWSFSRSERPPTDGRTVLQELDRGPRAVSGAPRPTARLRYVDAGALVVHWIWDHQPAAPRATVIERVDVAPALDRLAAALPNQRAGESGPDALARALGAGDLLNPARELALATALTAALVPQWLGLECNALEEAGLRPHLRIQPSASTAHVPWELLATSGTERLADMADVSVLLPASLRNDPERRVSPWRPDGAVALVLDPRVPGFGPASELGSVLGPVAPDDPVTRAVAALGERAAYAPSPGGPAPGAPAADPLAAVRRGDVGRAELAGLLAGGARGADPEPASRLLYVGHVTVSDHGLDTRMHLADTADAPGRAAPIGAHRPYSAADIALGAPGLAPLNAPARVALVACESGGEQRFAEPTGLVSAFAHRGAEYVTATRWTLPTEAGLARFAPGLAEGRAAGMLQRAVAAVDAAHEQADPVAALVAWQRAERAAWTATGDPRSSPIIWGAFATAWAPAPVPPGGR